MRPVRRYFLTFTTPGRPPVKLYALGETRCRAKQQGFEMLERLRRVEGWPASEPWRLAAWEDLGFA